MPFSGSILAAVFELSLDVLLEAVSGALFSLRVEDFLRGFFGENLRILTRKSSNCSWLYARGLIP